MHRIFQRDLSRLRLNTARSYVKIISEGHNMVGHSRFQRDGDGQLTTSDHRAFHVSGEGRRCA
jgi:hypothetical protein